MGRNAQDARQGGIGLRLAAALVVTTAVVAIAQYQLAGNALTERILAADLNGHRADADVLTAISNSGTADPMPEVTSLLGHAASRPGVSWALLVAPDGEVLLRGMKHSAQTATMPAAEMPAMELPAEQQLADVEVEVAGQVLATGNPRAVRVAAAQRVLHAVPVMLGDDRHVLLVERSDAPLQAQVASVRNVLLATLALGTALAPPLFFLFGGRRLTTRHRRAVDASTKDGLTGLGNHRFFHERLAVVVQESSAPLCLALVDLDGFKQVNDSAGHRRGDEVLAAVAAALLEASPTGAYRVGGDEFALVLPGGLADASATCESVRRRVADLRLGVTTSVGVAPRVTSVAQDLWDAADAALYAAKHGGRDRVVVDGSSTALLDA